MSILCSFSNCYSHTTSQVIIFPGRKLEYETRYNGKEKGNYFMTAVEFSPNDPYGKAVALMNLKYGFLEVCCLCYVQQQWAPHFLINIGNLLLFDEQIKEGWLVLPGILSAFIFSEFFQGLYSALNNCNFTTLTQVIQWERWRRASVQKLVLLPEEKKSENDAGRKCWLGTRKKLRKEQCNFALAVCGWFSLSYHE